MKRTFIAFLASLFICGMSMAQSPPAPQTQPPDSQITPNSAPVGRSQPEQTTNPRIAPGSVIPVELTKSIDAKKIKTGDEIVAKVTQDLKTNNGQVLVPKDTKVVGHVTEAQPRSKVQKESEIGIAFDHAVLKDGSEMKMPLSVQAIIASPNANSQNASSGGYDQPAGMPSAPASAGAAGGRGGMGGSAAQPQVPSAPLGGDTSSDAQAAGRARGPITGNTQGVVGISDLKLTTAAPDPAQGSLVSSEKNNVKLESGTLMLLRVNP